MKPNVEELKEMMKSTNSKGVVVIIAILIICGIVKLSIDYSDRKIKRNGKVTVAYIVSVEKYKKPTPPTINYYYVVDDDTIFYAYYVESIVDFKKLQSLEGKTLSVIYDTTNVKSNKLVIEEDDYR